MQRPAEYPPRNARGMLGGHSWKHPGGYKGLKCPGLSRVKEVIRFSAWEASGKKPSSLEGSA